MTIKAYLSGTAYILPFLCLFLLMASVTQARADNPVNTNSKGATIIDKGDSVDIGNEATHLTVEAGGSDIVHVTIGGQEILTVTKDGIRVQGNIEYTGRVKDIDGQHGSKSQ